MKFLKLTIGPGIVLWVMAVVAVAQATVILYEEVTYDSRIPVKSWGQVQVTNTPLRPKEDLELCIQRDKVRDDCPVAADRIAIASSGRVYDLVDRAWAGGKKNYDTLCLTYPMPELPEDIYVLRTMLTYTCPEFVWTTHQPDVIFKIEEH
jgi:hypothetical protein